MGSDQLARCWQVLGLGGLSSRPLSHHRYRDLSYNLDAIPSANQPVRYRAQLVADHMPSVSVDVDLATVLPSEVSSTQKPAVFPSFEAGRQLFRGAFPGALGVFFQDQLNKLGEGEAIRLRIVLDPGDPHLRAVWLLPWEIIALPVGNFLTLGGRVSVVRSVRGAPARPAQRQSSGDTALHVLVVAGHPGYGSREMDIKAEMLALGRVMRARKDIRVEFLHAATRITLQQKIRTIRPHLVHFIGHGSAKGDESSFGLWSEPEAPGAEPQPSHQRLDPVPASELASLFGEHDVGGVVLNCCHGAAPRADVDPVTTLAMAFVTAGVGAVVAMRSEIEDYAAGAFSVQFYAAIAQGALFDDALFHGRHALVPRLLYGVPQWAIPILFLQSAGDVGLPRVDRGRLPRDIGAFLAGPIPWWGLAALFAVAGFYYLGQRPPAHVQVDICASDVILHLDADDRGASDPGPGRREPGELPFVGGVGPLAPLTVVATQVDVQGAEYVDVHVGPTNVAQQEGESQAWRLLSHDASGPSLTLGDSESSTAQIGLARLFGVPGGTITLTRADGSFKIHLDRGSSSDSVPDDHQASEQPREFIEALLYVGGSTRLLLNSGAFLERGGHRLVNVELGIGAGPDDSAPLNIRAHHGLTLDLKGEAGAPTLVLFQEAPRYDGFRLDGLTVPTGSNLSGHFILTEMAGMAALDAADWRLDGNQRLELKGDLRITTLLIGGDSKESDIGQSESSPGEVRPCQGIRVGVEGEVASMRRMSSLQHDPVEVFPPRWQRPEPYRSLPILSVFLGVALTFLVGLTRLVRPERAFLGKEGRN